MALMEQKCIFLQDYGGLREKRFLFPFWDGRSVPQLNGDDTLKLRGLYPLSNQA